MPDEPHRFNIVGPEASNLKVAQMIADEMGEALYYRMVNFHDSRPGHDPRYSLDGSKLEEFGWTPSRTLEETIRSEEHTSELQSREKLVCRLLLEKKNTTQLQTLPD